jgi:Fe-S cluster assembly protein SufD
MTQATEQRMIRLSEATAVTSTASSDSPLWLKSLSEQAATRFAELGLPTRRHEEWRLTNLKPIAETNFITPDEAPSLDQATVNQFDIPDLTGSRLVFVNGRYAPEHSSLDTLPAGVLVLPLQEAIASHSGLVERHLGKYADVQDEAFTALNTALLGDGVFVFVPDTVKVEQPIHVLNVTASSSEPMMMNPRNLIVAGDHSHVTVIEDYVSVEQDVYFNNAVTEVVVGTEAHVSHYLLERESRNAFNISTLRIHQSESSDFASHSVMLGGAIVRNNIVPVLDGEHCDSLLNGLYLTSGTQHVDNHMRVEHAKPNCDSRQFYRGVLDDKSTAIFSGRIVVARDAQKTDAKQSNANLLLTDDARANTHPQLEIYADDVKCTHGATIGELDEDAIFYLMARGISESAARGMLIHAFAAESLERMTLQPVVDLLEAELYKRLPEGKMVQATL